MNLWVAPVKHKAFFLKNLKSSEDFDEGVDEKCDLERLEKKKASVCQASKAPPRMRTSTLRANMRTKLMAVKMTCWASDNLKHLFDHLIYNMFANFGMDLFKHGVCGIVV